MNLFDSTSIQVSRVVTNSYSTSFSMATGMLDKQQRDAIYAIYGFVRLADEIVDTFHEFPKEQLLSGFEKELYDSLELGISLNPILHSFQLVVKKYNIPLPYIEAFLSSMKSDLYIKNYGTRERADEYIHGSAEVVGLICLKVFTNGNDALFNELKVPAMKLGSTFQKVNFLRDLKNDMDGLGRTYFPEIAHNGFTEQCKRAIIADIDAEFTEAYTGIIKLPHNTKAAVLTAYYYYKVLLMQIKNTPAEEVLNSRVRISNFRKIILLMKAKIACQFNLL